MADFADMEAEKRGRDLSFHPVRNDAPNKLSSVQIAHFNEYGFIFPLDVFDSSGVQANRAYFDALLEQIDRADDGRNSYSINGYHRVLAGLYDLVKHPAILDYVEDILGPNFVAWGTHYFCKLPHDPKTVPWHQDASYWPLSPSKTVTVWLAIDDADRDNSAMKVIPGTHDGGHLQWKKAEGDAVLWQEVVNPEKFGEPEYIELKAGQISMHSDMLVHGSDPNESDRRRCGLTIRYAAMDVRATDSNEWNKNGIWCRGEDPTGHWANLARPESDDIESAPSAIKSSKA